MNSLKRVCPSSRMIRISPQYVRRSTTSSSTGESGSKSSIPKQDHESSTLAILPLPSVARSYFITAISSSPLLLNSAMFFLRRMVQPSAVLFNIDRNPVLNWIMRKTFYAQFCAGENENQVKQSTDQLRSMGYSGIILEYADEVLEEDGKRDETVEQGIQNWKNDLVQSISMCQRGDFVGLKWSGMGSKALDLMQTDQDPSPTMFQAMTDVCDAALEKNVFLLPAAEPQNAQKMVDAWTLKLAEKYNQEKAVVYNTYQCYLKSTPSTLSKHLSFAREQNFVLGVKLVRGAYLETETRNLIWDTKEETDDSYNQLAEALLKKEYNSFLTGKGAFPKADLVLATHNEESVLKARKIRDVQVEETKITLSFAQLFGMADEVSLALVKARKETNRDVPAVYKCLAWGSMKQCLHYLLRRAEENKDAIGRTKTTRNAMRVEIWRRLKGSFGL